MRGDGVADAPHPDLARLRAAVAATARRLARLGLVAAFGHVSARHGDGAVITSVLPLAGQSADDTLVIAADGTVIDGPSGEVPLETPMHLAIYRARTDVGAICRGHPPATVVLGTRLDAIPLLHGLGALAGRHVPVHPDVDLITTPASGEAVAATLGDGSAVVLRANGALAVGADLATAGVALWALEDRARVALGAVALGRDASPVSDTAWDARMRHTAPEMRRAARWFDAIPDAPSTAHDASDAPTGGTEVHR